VVQALTEVYDGAVSRISGRRYQPLAKTTSGVPEGRGQASKGRAVSRLRRPLFYAALGLCLIAGLMLYSRSGNSVPHPDVVGDSRASVSREQFIEAILREPVEGVLDPDPIREKCNSIKFQEGLVWHCGVVSGRIGTAGNEFLNCVRYAIEAGDMLLDSTCFVSLQPDLGFADLDTSNNFDSAPPRPSFRQTSSILAVRRIP
jgi:hypothetical protein